MSMDAKCSEDELDVLFGAFTGRGASHGIMEKRTSRQARGSLPPWRRNGRGRGSDSGARLSPVSFFGSPVRSGRPSFPVWCRSAASQHVQQTLCRPVARPGKPHGALLGDEDRGSLATGNVRYENDRLESRTTADLGLGLVLGLGESGALARASTTAQRGETALPATYFFSLAASLTMSRIAFRVWLGSRDQVATTSATSAGRSVASRGPESACFCAVSPPHVPRSLQTAEFSNVSGDCSIPLGGARLRSVTP